MPAKIESLLGFHAAQIKNLSRTGALITTDAPLRMGAQLVLHRGEIEAFATVVRTGGTNSYGLEFEDQLTDGQVIAARQQSENQVWEQHAERLAAAKTWALGKRDVA